MRFDVDLWARARYIIEADTKEEAIEQAMEFWENLIPDTFCEELQPNCNTCYNSDMDTLVKAVRCSRCENYSFYSPID